MGAAARLKVVATRISCANPSNQFRRKAVRAWMVIDQSLASASARVLHSKTPNNRLSEPKDQFTRIVENALGRGLALFAASKAWIKCHLL
jgi:hypothetical protein